MAKNFPNYIEEDYSDINALKRIIEQLGINAKMNEL